MSARAEQLYKALLRTLDPAKKAHLQKELDLEQARQFKALPMGPGSSKRGASSTAGSTDATRPYPGDKNRTTAGGGADSKAAGGSQAPLPGSKTMGTKKTKKSKKN